MRIAALYDIHANLPALEAVLNDLQRENIDAVVVGGDVLAGPYPTETVFLLRELTVPTYWIRGNAESEMLRVLSGREPYGLSNRADEEAYWLASIVDTKVARFVATWPATIGLTVSDGTSILFCHATPNSDTLVFTRDTEETNIAPEFAEATADLVVCGHTHMQFDRTIGGTRVVNAGSVGMPFGRAGADWLIVDERIHFRHTVYDPHIAAERIRRSGYPHAEEFVQGNVLSFPPENEALRFLKRLEVRQSGGT